MSLKHLVIICFLFNGIIFAEEQTSLDETEYTEESNAIAQTSIGLQLEYGLGLYNAKTTLQLPIYQYPMDNRISIGPMLTFAIADKIEVFASPMYSFQSMNAFFFYQPNIQLHSLLSSAGFNFWFSKTRGLTIGALMNYEFSGKLLSVRSVPGSNSRIDLVPGDRAVPGFGAFAGFNFSSESRTTNFFIGAEAFKVALQRYFIGVKIGFQFRFTQL